MNSLPLFSRSIVRNGLRQQQQQQPWICSQCARSLRNSSLRRSLQTSQTPKQKPNAAPTQEQLREPFKNKNRNTLYYTLSIILGTVALSYGSVPMYKMICQQM